MGSYCVNKCFHVLRIVFKVQIISSGSKKGGIHGIICGTGKMYGVEGISFFGKSRGRIIFSRIIHQRTRK